MWSIYKKIEKKYIFLGLLFLLSGPWWDARIYCSADLTFTFVSGWIFPISYVFTRNSPISCVSTFSSIHRYLSSIQEQGSQEIYDKPFYFTSSAREMRGQGYRHDNPKILFILLVTATPRPGGRKLRIDSFILRAVLNVILCLKWTVKLGYIS